MKDRAILSDAILIGSGIVISFQTFTEENKLTKDITLNDN